MNSFFNSIHKLRRKYFLLRYKFRRFVTDFAYWYIYFTRPFNDFVTRVITSRLGLILLILIGGVFINGFAINLLRILNENEYLINENIYAEILGISFTVLVIDLLYDIRRRKELKERMFIEISSSDNGTATRAALIMQSHNWLHDGTMERRSLFGADLSELILKEKTKFSGVNISLADFSKVTFLKADFSNSIGNVSLDGIGTKFTDANLFSCDFSNAHLPRADYCFAELHRAKFITSRLTGAFFVRARCFNVNFLGAYANMIQLALCDGLMGATLPDGTKYDGRLNLPGDLEFIFRETNIDLTEIIAGYYGVTERKYIEGQNWFKDEFIGFMDWAKDYHKREVLGDTWLFETQFSWVYYYSGRKAYVQTIKDFYKENADQLLKSIGII